MIWNHINRTCLWPAKKPNSDSDKDHTWLPVQRNSKFMGKSQGISRLSGEENQILRENMGTSVQE